LALRLRGIQRKIVEDRQGYVKVKRDEIVDSTAARMLCSCLMHSIDVIMVATERFPSTTPYTNDYRRIRLNWALLAA
jgi:hypothetical protein